MDDDRIVEQGPHAELIALESGAPIAILSS